MDKIQGWKWDASAHKYNSPSMQCCGGRGDSKTAYSQQLRYLTKETDKKDPRDNLLENLSVEINKWSSDGDSIIIIKDLN